MASLAGKEYEPVPFRTDPEQVAAFARAVGADPAAGVPPTFAFVAAFATGMQMALDPDGEVNVAMLVHGEQEFRWERHPEVGEELTASARVVSDEDRRGMRFLTLETRIGPSGGEPVATSRMLDIIRG